MNGAPAITQIGVLANGNRQRWFEVILVVLVSCGSPVLYSFYLLKNGPGAAPHVSATRWLVGIVQEVTALLLLGYILSRRSQRFRDIGLTWSIRHVGMGLVIGGLSYASYFLGSMLVQVVHYKIYGAFVTGPSGRDFFAHPSLVALPFSLLNPFFEELIVRAYLMTEVRELTGSTLLAVVLSVFVQFSYHLYYGWTGAISISFVFLVFAFYYARSRRALPIIVAHGIFDIYGLVQLWRV